MGASFTNLHVRNSSAAAVGAMAKNFAETRGYVSPDANGWVTVYDEAADSQNIEILCDMAAGISKELKTVVIAFMVHDSDIAFYWVYKDGSLVDEFDSCPDYFQSVDDATKQRVKGRTEVLLPLCVPGTTLGQLEDVLHSPDGPPTFAEDLVRELGNLLGIDEGRIGLGFEYFDSEGAEMLPDANAFEPIGKDSERKTAAAPKAQTPTPDVDSFDLAVGMLTQIWDTKWKEQFEEARGKLVQLFGKQDSEGLPRQIAAGLDKSAKEFLKQSKLADRPTFEEMKAARESGPEAFAAFLTSRAPSRLGSIADGAMQSGLEAFIAALLAHGLDPYTKNQHGEPLLGVAEKRYKDLPVHRLFKEAAEKRAGGNV